MRGVVGLHLTQDLRPFDKLRAGSGLHYFASFDFAQDRLFGAGSFLLGWCGLVFAELEAKSNTRSLDFARDDSGGKQVPPLSDHHFVTNRLRSG